MASDDAGGLSLEEKLRIIDQEIRTLHEFCTSKGFDPYKVEMCAKPVLKMVTESKMKRLLNYSAVIAGVVAVMVGLMYIPPVYKTTTAYARRASISVSIRISLHFFPTHLALNFSELSFT